LYLKDIALNLVKDGGVSANLTGPKLFIIWTLFTFIRGYNLLFRLLPLAIASSRGRYCTSWFGRIIFIVSLLKGVNYFYLLLFEGLFDGAQKETKKVDFLLPGHIADFHLYH